VERGEHVWIHTRRLAGRVCGAHCVAEICGSTRVDSAWQSRDVNVPVTFITNSLTPSRLHGPVRKDIDCHIQYKVCIWRVVDQYTIPWRSSMAGPAKDEFGELSYVVFSGLIQVSRHILRTFR
jgi:hypothetical protein